MQSWDATLATHCAMSTSAPRARTHSIPGWSSNYALRFVVSKLIWKPSLQRSLISPKPIATLCSWLAPGCSTPCLQLLATSQLGGLTPSSSTATVCRINSKIPWYCNLAALQALSLLLAEELAIPLPRIPWHAQRERIAATATSLGLLSGTLAKIARDLSLHTQTEVGELSEPPSTGRGGSSTMPHKQNPVASAAILAATMRVPALVSTVLGALS